MKEFSNYQEAENAAVLLCFQEKHGEAIELLKNLLHQYPEKLHNIAWGLVFNYCMNGQYEKALDMSELALKKGIQGSIITGDNDESLPEQQDAVKILKEAGFPIRFIVNPGMYHWFPEDFGKQLDLAIAHINNS
jgi:acetyl esterase/lipase